MGLSCGRLHADAVVENKDTEFKRPISRKTSESWSLEGSEDRMDTGTKSAKPTASGGFAGLSVSVPIEVSDEPYEEGLYDTEDESSPNEEWGVGTPLFEERTHSFEFGTKAEDFVRQLSLLSDSVESLSVLVKRQLSIFDLTQFPPIAKATLQLQLGVFRLCDETMSSPTRKRSSPRKGSLRKKRVVRVKCRYLYGAECVKRKSEKYKSRECDSGVVDIRETLEFPLQTRADGDAVGHFELLVKQMSGRFAMDKVLGYTSFSLRECLLNGVIDRSGDGTEATLEFFAKKRMEHILPTVRKGDDDDNKDSTFEEDDSDVRGHIDLKLQLTWNQKTWNDFKYAMAQKCDGGAVVVADKMHLMQTHSTKLKLTVVGALLGQRSVDEWMQMEESELCPTMKQMGSCHGDYGDKAVVSRVSVSVLRRFNGEDDAKHGEEHASKVDEAVFIGEEHDFDVAPYFKRKAKLSDGCSMESGIAFRIHPQLEFSDFDDGEENPGYLLLSVQKSEGVGVEEVTKTLGCTLLKITEMLDAAALVPESMRSAESLFVEPMFRPLPSTRSSRHRKHLRLPLVKTGSIFCKCHFEWL